MSKRDMQAVLTCSLRRRHRYRCRDLPPCAWPRAPLNRSAPANAFHRQKCRGMRFKRLSTSRASWTSPVSHSLGTSTKIPGDLARPEMTGELTFVSVRQADTNICRFMCRNCQPRLSLDVLHEVSVPPPQYLASHESTSTEAYLLR